MSAPPNLRPIARRKVAAGAVVVLLLFVLLVVIGEALRHPGAGGGRGQSIVGSDPRTPLQCPEPAPREGQQREEEADRGGEATQVTSGDLYDCPQVYDGQRVRFRGEVVGALLDRGDHTWVQLNDDAYAEDLGPLPTHRDYRGSNSGVGVVLPDTLATRIATVGGPDARGDVLVVEGTFHRVDRTGEATVIRADAGEIARPGEQARDPLRLDRVVAAGGAATLAIAVVIAARVRGTGR